MLEESILPVEVISVSEQKPYVHLSTLSVSDRQLAWDHLKRNHPETAKLLRDMKSDKAIQELIAFFEVSICLDAALFKGTGVPVMNHKKCD